MQASEELPDPGSMQVTNKLKTVYSVLMFLGGAGFVVTLITNPERAWFAYLTGFFYFVTLGIGGLFFTAIQHASSAGWSVNIRRFCEALYAFLPYGFVAGLIFLAGGIHYIYIWLDPQVVAEDPVLQGKASYLNEPFLWVRFIVFFGLWLWFGKKIVGLSLQQDKTGEEKLTHKVVPYSVIFLLLFALSYSLFSVDTLMSLQPHWFSTIFGVYTFAGLFQSTMAVVILIILYFMNKGQLRGYVDENHLHDLGKFMFAFTVFWAYIAFSQHMLIWYANIPEETMFFLPRSKGEWMWVSLALIVVKFIVPFIALLPRWAKRTHSHLAAVSVWILASQYLDVYWMVYPNYNMDHVVFSLPEILVFAGFLGLFLFAVSRFLSRHCLVPVRDPRIHESLHHHVTY